MRWEKLEITHLTSRKFPYVPLAIFCLFRLLLPFFRLCEIYITTPSKVLVSFLVNLNFTWEEIILKIEYFITCLKSRIFFQTTFYLCDKKN